MNSEKVKEIKKALEERTQHKPINCNYSEYVEACGMYCRHRREYMGTKNGQTCKNCSDFIATGEVKEDTDILTLINELETENERLMKLQSRGGCRVAELGIENKQLKDRIAELEDEIKRLETVVDIANERSYRKKFIEEWRKEYQKELDKEGEGHIAGFPDFDLVYKLYFEQKDRIAELENTDYYKEIERKKEELLCKEYSLIKYEKEIAVKYLKQFAERLKEHPTMKIYSLHNACERIPKAIDETLKEYEK